jgi:hypothetical protein
MNASSYRRTLLALTQAGLITAELAARQLGDTRILSDFGVENAAIDLNECTAWQDRQARPPRSARPLRSLRGVD